MYSPQSPPPATLSRAGLTPAVPVEEVVPSCECCSWVVVHSATTRRTLKMISGRCAQHGLDSGLKLVSWSARPRAYWAVGRAS
jgi:hypothetical protein